MRTTKTTRTAKTTKRAKLKEIRKQMILESLIRDYSILGKKYNDLCYRAVSKYPDSFAFASRYVEDEIKKDFKVKSAYRLVNDVKNRIKTTRSQNLQNDEFSDFVCDAAVVLSAISCLSQESDNFYTPISVDSDSNIVFDTCDSYSDSYNNYDSYDSYSGDCD